MNDNRAFWKAFHSLTHPLSIMAILLLLVNDHWLRYVHPSWLTGKLGDFTWLIFAPFIAALLFSWFIPRTWKRQTQIVGCLSIGFIGIWIATAKTIPFVHELTTKTLYTIVGWEGQLRLDVTDLLTLPALIISGYIWHKASDEKVSLKPLAYVALGLGILGTVATSGPSYRDDYGITGVCQQEDKLFIETFSIYGNLKGFESSDGGLNWEEVSIENNGRFDCAKSVQLPISVENSLIIAGKDLMFQWIPDQHIKLSEDGGNYWEIDYEFTVFQEQIRSIYRKIPYNGGLLFVPADHVKDNPSPLSAHYHGSSGNVIFAMGWNGLLVRTPQGQYHWITVGEYGLYDLSNFELIYPALLFEFWLAFALIFLIVVSSTARIRYLDAKYRFGFLWFGWSGFGIILTLLLFARLATVHITEYSLIGFVSLFCLIFLAIPLSIGAV